MRKADLLARRLPLASKEMMAAVEADVPVEKTETIWYNGEKRKYITYKHKLYMRCRDADGILEVGLYLPAVLRSGGRQPAFRIFIDYKAEKYLTYDMQCQKWREAMLGNLNVHAYGWPVYTKDTDTWITARDAEIIKKRLKSEKGDDEAVHRWQARILEKQNEARHRRKTDPWDADMALIGKLPADWDRWVHRNAVAENYIFYDYTRKGADTGYCSVCGKFVPIKTPKHNEKTTCPQCGRAAVFKSTGKAGHIETSHDPAYLVQRCKGGFAVRMFMVWRMYKPGAYQTPEIYHHETRRTLYIGGNVKAYAYEDYANRGMRWCADEELGYKVPAPWYQTTARWNGAVYPSTIPSLSKNELKHSGLPLAIKTVKKIDPEYYLSVERRYPVIERIVKSGLPRLAKEFLDTSQGRESVCKDLKDGELTKSLRISGEQLRRLRVYNGGAVFLLWLQYEKGRRPIPDDTLLWMQSKKIEPSRLGFILDKMSPLQIQNYLTMQVEMTGETVNQIINTWADYLSMASRVGIDTTDAIVYRCKDLNKRHAQLVRKLKDPDLHRRAAKISKKYPHVDAVIAGLAKKYQYAGEKFCIIAPGRIEDVLYEGDALNHCVGSSDRYFDRIERREAYILFLRRVGQENTPWYTLEIEPDGTIRQKRTKYNRQDKALKEAEPFLKEWQAKVAKRLTAEDKQLQTTSKALREENFAQLARDKTKVNFGEHAGELLMDVLKADLLESVTVTSA